LSIIKDPCSDKEDKEKDISLKFVAIEWSLRQLGLLDWLNLFDGNSYAIATVIVFLRKTT
jgi:hypothetical protein